MNTQLEVAVSRITSRVRPGRRPKPPVTHRFTVSVLALATLLVTACSPPATDESSNDSASASFAERYLDYSLGTVGGEDAAELEERLFNEIQNRIAQCMKAEGFTYHPAVDIRSWYGTSFSFTTEQEARTHGFGIVASAREMALPPPLSKNDEYVMALDPAAQQAYNDAIDGDPSLPDDGCIGTAEHDAMDYLGITDLVAATNSDFHHEVQADPRMVSAEQEWVACVREAGFDTNAANLPEFTAEFEEEFQAIVGPGSSEAALDSPAVEAFQAKEIEAALATLPCNQKRNEILATVERDHLTNLADLDI